MVLQYRLRLYLVAFLVIGAFGGLLIRLWDVQITNQSLYAKQLSPTQTITVRVPGVRGEIKDRYGETLVSNRLEYQLVVNLRVLAEDYDPAAYGRVDENGEPKMPMLSREVSPDGIPIVRQIKDIATIVDDAVLGPLAELGLEIEFPNKELADRELTNHYDMTSPPGLVPYTLPLALTYPQFAMLSERSLEIPGLRPQASPVREYNYGSLACHILGYVRKADRAKDIEDLKGRASGEDAAAKEARRWLRYDHIYEPDPFGYSAIEKTMDHYLKGRAGLREHLIDQKGVYVRDIRYEPPQQGFNVKLTLDLRAQYIVEKALRMANGGKGIGRGAAVVLDPNTGGVLAMASVPSFDPNKFIPAITLNDYRLYKEDESDPLFHRAVNPYAPGSTFKIPVALAGALNGVQGYTTVCSGGVTYGNRKIHCMGFHHEIGLQRALMKSCNSFFYRYGNQAGIENIKRVTNMMGLGKKLGLPISESPGLILDPAWMREHRPREKWSSMLTAQSSIGQGGVACSPLQMAVVAAVAANGGKCYQVRLIESIEEADGSVVEEFPPKLLYDLTEHGVRPEVVETVRQGMYDVVNAPGGTARRARLDDVDVAGKTGTAQKYTDSGTHAWFIAFAPFDKPQYALAVFVEDGESGGRVGAPIAKRILQELFRGSLSHRFRKLEDAQGHFDIHSEIAFEGDLWTVPEGEMDTADTAVSFENPEILEPVGTTNSEHKPQSSEIRERASIVPSRGTPDR